MQDDMNARLLTLLHPIAERAPDLPNVSDEAVMSNIVGEMSLGDLWAISIDSSATTSAELVDHATNPSKVSFVGRRAARCISDPKPDTFHRRSRRSLSQEYTPEHSQDAQAEISPTNEPRKNLILEDVQLQAAASGSEEEYARFRRRASSSFAIRSIPDSDAHSDGNACDRADTCDNECDPNGSGVCTHTESSGNGHGSDSRTAQQRTARHKPGGKYQEEAFSGAVSARIATGKKIPTQSPSLMGSKCSV